MKGTDCGSLDSSPLSALMALLAVSSFCSDFKISLNRHFWFVGHTILSSLIDRTRPFVPGIFSAVMSNDWIATFDGDTDGERMFDTVAPPRIRCEAEQTATLSPASPESVVPAKPSFRMPTAS